MEDRIDVNGWIENIELAKQRRNSAGGLDWHHTKIELTIAVGRTTEMELAVQHWLADRFTLGEGFGVTFWKWSDDGQE